MGPTSLKEGREVLLPLEWTASSELGPRGMLESNSSFTEHFTPARLLAGASANLVITCEGPRG